MPTKRRERFLRAYISVDIDKGAIDKVEHKLGFAVIMLGRVRHHLGALITNFRRIEEWDEEQTLYYRHQHFINHKPNNQHKPHSKLQRNNVLSLWKTQSCLHREKTAQS